MKDDDTKKKLLELIEQGAPIAKACKKVGIHRDTFYEWKKDDGFGIAVAHARLYCLAETNDAAEYWMHAWVRQGDKKSVYKWLDSQNPMFMRDAVKITFRDDGPTLDEDAVPSGFTKEDFFMVLGAHELSGMNSFNIEGLSKNLKREYSAWKEANRNRVPNGWPEDSR
ncbi:MAG: helix-turn-helix domain-containing protein [Candidatus Paceibacterota bacterium]|jgi:hypothetical protein